MDTKRETSDGLVTVTYTRDPRCRITFTIIGEPDAAVSLRSISDVALALALTGVPVGSHLTLAQVASLVIASLRRFGPPVIRALTEWDASVNLRMLDQAASPGQLRDQRELWGGDRRSQACVDAAYRLIGEVRRGAFPSPEGFASTL
jgi:hypothetical protein